MIQSKGVVGLHAIKVGKSFPGVRALDGVDLEIKAGEVHALVGANGAGKSTFAKILAGAYESYDGEVRIDGRRIALISPAKALQAGICPVHQEVDTVLVPHLSVAENLLIFEQASSKGRAWVNWSEFHRRARDLLKQARIKVSFDVATRAADLSLAEKQLLVVIRAVLFGSHFIIFDEPTAALGLQEARFLFETIRSLRDRGIGILYISHRMPEVFDIADRITVFRDGRKVDTVTTKDVTVQDVIRLMLGKSLDQQYQRERSSTGGEELLTVRRLYKAGKVDFVSLNLRRGEVLGITGLVGAGKTELARVLFGADTRDAGEVWLEGREIDVRSPRDAVANGIFLVPEERRRQGLLVGENVGFNLSLPSIGVFSGILGFVKRKAEGARVLDAIRRLHVVCSGPGQTVANLSGGNQQKTSIGKWMLHGWVRRGKVFIFDDPTKGVDIGAKAEIYRLMEQLAREGYGVVFMSPDIDEIMGISDRILVMYQHRVVAEMNRDSATPERILRFATGGGEAA